MFELWSWYHILYIISPFALAVTLFLVFRNKEEKVKWLVALILGILMTALLIARNIEISIKAKALDAEVIPLQVCHIANFIFLFGALFKNRTILTVGWGINTIAALLSIIFADSLTNYSTLLTWRAQAYIFGHLLIVGCGIFVFLSGLISFKIKTILKAFLVMAVWLIICFFQTRSSIPFLRTKTQIICILSNRKAALRLNCSSN